VSKILKILQFPHPALFTPCYEVPKEGFNAELIKNLDAMWDTMIDAEGLGLAANQVGLFDKMFVMRGPLGYFDKLYFVNPKITWESSDKSTITEGCLSAPGEFLSLGRSNTVIVKYQDEKGVSKERFFTGVHAVCVLHEIEHLNGVSFMQHDSIPKKMRKELAKKWDVV